MVKTIKEWMVAVVGTIVYSTLLICIFLATSKNIQIAIGLLILWVPVMEELEFLVIKRPEQKQILKKFKD